MPRPATDLEQKLLTAAAHVIADEGVEALTLRDLARRTGVSRAAPYHYFRDRAELVARVGELGFTRLSEQLIAAASAHTDPIERLRAGLVAYIQFALDEPHFFRLMFANVLARNSAQPVDAAVPFDFSSASARDTFGALLDAIRDAQAQGSLPSTDPLLVANVLWAYTHGIAVLAQGSHLKHAEGHLAVFDAGFTAIVGASWSGGRSGHRQGKLRRPLHPLE